MNKDFSGMSQAELARILDEAEGQISEIRTELERRKQKEQHEAIDELELTTMHTGVDWHQVQAFFAQVLEELRRGRQPK